MKTEENYAPVAQVALLMWNTSREFYVEYENIRRKITHEEFKGTLTAGALEAAIFFLFILEMAIIHFNQIRDAADYISDYSYGLLMGIFKSLGNENQIDELIDARLLQYTKSRHFNTNNDPDSFFQSGNLHNPVLNNILCADQTDTGLAPLNCPVIIEDIFNAFTITTAANTLYINTSAPYRCALETLFKCTNDIRLLTPTDATQKITAGLERGKNPNSPCQA